MDIIGRNFVLWRTEFKLDAYTDQMGKSHPGYVVLEEYPVTVIETRKVRGMWGSGEYEGWKAITSQGRWFTCNWCSFPDDSMTPTYYWDVQGPDDDLWQPVDAEQAANYGQVYVRPDGSRAMPIGSSYCQEHDQVYLPDSQCWKCEMRELNSKRSK